MDKSVRSVITGRNNLTLGTERAAVTTGPDTTVNLSSNQKGWAHHMLGNKGAHTVNGNMEQMQDLMPQTVNVEHLAASAPTSIPTNFFRGRAATERMTVTDEIKVSDNAVIPTVKDLGNIRLAPLQMFAFATSRDIHNTWSIDMLDPTLIKHVLTDITVDGEINRTQDFIWKAPFQQHHGIPVSLQTTQKVWNRFQLRGNARMDIHHAHKSVRLLPELEAALNSMATHESNRTIKTMLEPVRQIGSHIRPANANALQEGVQRLGHVRSLWQTSSGISLVRFFTCAWIDFLSMHAISDDRANWTFGGAGVNGYPPVPRYHYADVGPHRAPPVGGNFFGSERSVWDHMDQLADGTSFFIDASEMAPMDVRMASRYAQSFPPERVRRNAPPGSAGHRYLNGYS